MAVPKSKAPFTGSSWYDVPGSLKPSGVTVPGTMGPSICLHSALVWMDSMAQARESSKAMRDVRQAFADSIL